MPKFHLTEQQKTVLEFRHKNRVMLGNVTALKRFCSGLKAGRRLDDYLKKEKLNPESSGSEGHLSDEQTEQLIDHLSDYAYAHLSNCRLLEH